MYTFQIVPQPFQVLAVVGTTALDIKQINQSKSASKVNRGLCALLYLFECELTFPRRARFPLSIASFFYRLDLSPLDVRASQSLSNRLFLLLNVEHLPVIVVVACDAAREDHPGSSVFPEQTIIYNHLGRYVVRGRMVGVMLLSLAVGTISPFCFR